MSSDQAAGMRQWREPPPPGPPLHLAAYLCVKEKQRKLTVHLLGARHFYRHHFTFRNPLVGAETEAHARSRHFLKDTQKIAEHKCVSPQIMCCFHPLSISVPDCLPASAFLASIGAGLFITIIISISISVHTFVLNFLIYCLVFEYS